MKQPEVAKEIVEAGIARHRQNTRSAVERGQESTLGYSRALIRHTLSGFVQSIRSFVSEESRQKVGARYSARQKLVQLDPERIALLTARAIIDKVSQPKRGWREACFAVGGLIHDEILFDFINRTMPELWGRLWRKTNEMNAYYRKRQLIVRVFNEERAKGKINEDFTFWSRVDILMVGAFLIEMFIQETGLVKKETIREGKRRAKCYLVPRAETLQWIQDYESVAETLKPLWTPFTEPPPDWQHLWGGVEEVSAIPFVKTSNKEHLKLIEQGNLSRVYGAVNALQQTEWKVNREVLEVAQQLWKTSRSVGCLISREEKVPMPEKPRDIDSNEEARKEWRQQAREVHLQNVRLNSKRIMIDRILRTADWLKKEKALYFLYQADFRGRIYDQSTFLSPQGNDLSKALLTFAVRKPILEKEQARWLMIHGSNLWGYDKVPFNDRIQWVKDHDKEIKRSALDPFEFTWWQQADSPWQFLAFCQEWRLFETVGYGFLSGLPIALDGSNNGLQILSLLTRDTTGAQQTNIIPSQTPQDIYQDVAEETTRRLEQDIDEGGEDSAKAAFWLNFKVTRYTTKRSVMVIPYGGSFHANLKYVRGWFQEEATDRGLKVTPEEFRQLTLYLSIRIWDAIQKLIGRPLEYMGWLHKVANLFTDHGLPIVWESPMGFPVVQQYPEIEWRTVRTRIGYKILMQYPETTERLNRRQQKDGLSPNFVHSLDAAAMQRTVELGLELGIQSFGMVHDSFATVAADCDALAAALRRAYADIFSDDQTAILTRQLQKQLPEGVEFPAPPEQGDLDPTQLVDSEYFFS